MQGVKRLARGLEPLCYSPDGLIEGFYDPSFTDPARGKFRVGLQWHPVSLLRFGLASAHSRLPCCCVMC